MNMKNVVIFCDFRPRTFSALINGSPGMSPIFYITNLHLIIFNITH